MTYVFSPIPFLSLYQVNDLRFNDRSIKIEHSLLAFQSTLLFQLNIYYPLWQHFVSHWFLSYLLAVRCLFLFSFFLFSFFFFKGGGYCSVSRSKITCNHSVCRIPYCTLLVHIPYSAFTLENLLASSLSLSPWWLLVFSLRHDGYLFTFSSLTTCNNSNLTLLHAFWYSI